MFTKKIEKSLSMRNAVFQLDFYAIKKYPH